MNDNIDKNEIRRVINRLQEERHCGFVYDATRFESIENVNSLSNAIDMISKRIGEDSEINIICEFAKLYLEGVRPTIEPKRGEWIPCSKRLPSSDGNYLVNYHSPRGNNRIYIQNFMNGDWYPNYGASYITAWIPLPEPYKEEGEEK